MRQLIGTYGYVTKWRVPARDRAAKVTRVVETSKREYEQHGFTGALIHAGEYVAQVVEGTPGHACGPPGS